jgi:Mycotoxin biosynthesis protein UstYa
MIRDAWFLLITYGNSALSNSKSFPNHPANEPLAPPVQDCFDYLRQSILCHADSTLEPFLESDGVTLTTQGSSGWGVQHKCRLFDQLRAWVAGHDALSLGWDPWDEMRR